MSKKTKASSKNKKAPAKKVAKKPAPKKVVAKKKVTKPVAKAKPVKKTTSKAKPAPKKTVVKKLVKKATSKKVVKKAVAKKIVAKKPAKKAAPKKVVKKAVAKKPVVKPKPVAKKITVKVAPKKVVAKTKPVVAKKVEKVVSVKEVKTVKPVVEKAAKVAKPAPAPVKKQIVAPTTYRVEEANLKPVKEPSGKFEMEFVVRASEDMVYEFVSTESGLSEWFCDDVNIRNGIFTFTWDGQTQQARLVKENPPFFIRYQWLDKNDGSYFEFKTQKDELTNDISLIITDFAESKADEESARLLWESQVDKLLHVLGSFF